MNNFVIDTNVLVAANEKADHLNEIDVQKCQSFIMGIYKRCRISIDSLNLIFEEYFRYADRSGRPGLGDMFAAWLFRNQYNSHFCEIVRITPINEEKTDFEEFPKAANLSVFDPSDREFVAVALTSKYSPEICNACDSDWKEYEQALKEAGVRLRFVL